MGATLRTGGLAPRHRGRIEEILGATKVFRREEIDVALELFDDVFAVDAAPPATSYHFLGAFTPEDELVGYACYGPTPETDRTYDLYWIAVDPEQHGRGSGTTILTEVERRLEGQNARMLIVETSSRSEYASTRHFYETRGYAEAARVREFYAPGDDRIIFSKRIHSPQGRGAVRQ